MATARSSVAIHAPAEKVFEALVDWNSYPQWFAGMREVAEIKGDPRQPGTEGSFVYQVLGVKFTEQWTVDSTEPARKIRNRMAGAFPGDWEWSIEPNGDGAVTVTGLAEYTVPGGVLGKVANQLLLERMNQKNMESTLEALKIFCET